VHYIAIVIFPSDIRYLSVLRLMALYELLEGGDSCLIFLNQAGEGLRAVLSVSFWQVLQNLIGVHDVEALILEWEILVQICPINSDSSGLGSQESLHQRANRPSRRPWTIMRSPGN
jgi:hypothetical protein